jgi:hypothetical protein
MCGRRGAGAHAVLGAISRNVFATATPRGIRDSMEKGVRLSHPVPIATTTIPLTRICGLHRIGIKAPFVIGQTIPHIQCPKGELGMEEKTESIYADVNLAKTTTYHIQGKTFIVEPVFRSDSTETIASILLKLIMEDAP